MAQELDSDGEEFWQSVADQMSGLMLVFMFIAIAYALDASLDKARMQKVAVAYNQNREAIYRALDSTFKEELPKWDAELDSVSLSIRFKEPDVLFRVGSAEVQPGFRRILDSFFPRYVAVIRRHEGSIEEIRIEGHTSSESRSPNPYYANMALSQERTRGVLEYCLEGTRLAAGDKRWLQTVLTANGLSSSRLRLTADGTEDRASSRRVEFRIRTNAEVRLAEILRPAK